MVVRSSTFQRPGTAKLSRRSAPHNSLKHRGSLTHNHSSVSIRKVRQASSQPAQAHQRQEAMREEMKRLQSDCRNPEHVWKSEKVWTKFTILQTCHEEIAKGSILVQKQIGSATLSDSTPPELLPNRKPAASLKPLQLSYSQYSIIFAFYTQRKLLKLENLAISSLCVAGMREDFSYASWVGERTPPTTLRLKRMLHDVTWCFQIPTLLQGTAFLK